MGDWRENKALGIIGIVVAAVVVVLSAILVFQPKKLEVTLMSEGSSELFTMKLPATVEYPLLNPKTGVKDLYPAPKVKCEKCGWEGNLIRKKAKMLTTEEVKAGKQGGGEHPLACPKCGYKL